MITRFLLLLALTTMAAPSAMAQRGSPVRVPVLLLLLDTVSSAEEPYVLHRRADGDVIALAADATGDDLSDAVISLLAIRRRHGDTAATPGRMRVRAPVHAGAEREERSVSRKPALPWIPRVLSDLRRAPPTEIEGVGRGRVLRIWLPRQRSAYAPSAPPPGQPAPS